MIRIGLFLDYCKMKRGVSFTGFSDFKNIYKTSVIHRKHNKELNVDNWSEMCKYSRAKKLNSLQIRYISTMSNIGVENIERRKLTRCILYQIKRGSMLGIKCYDTFVHEAYLKHSMNTFAQHLVLNIVGSVSKYFTKILSTAKRLGSYKTISVYLYDSMNIPFRNVNASFSKGVLLKYDKFKRLILLLNKAFYRSEERFIDLGNLANFVIENGGKFSIDMACYHLSYDSHRKMLEKMKNIKKLTYFNLSDTEETNVEAISNIDYSEYKGISFRTTTEKFFQFAKGLKDENKLEYLSASLQGGTKKANLSALSFLQDKVNLTSFKLHLYENKFDKTIVSKVAKFLSFQVNLLRLSLTFRAANDNIGALLEKMSTNNSCSTLKSFSLSTSMFKLEDLDRIANFLKRTTLLEQVNIEFTNWKIKDSMFYVVIKSLEDLVELTELKLSFNTEGEVTLRTLKDLLNTLENSSSLSEVIFVAKVSKLEIKKIGELFAYVNVNYSNITFNEDIRLFSKTQIKIIRALLNGNKI